MAKSKPPAVLYSALNIVRTVKSEEQFTYESGATGYRAVAIGREKVLFDVLIDLNQIYALAHKAAKNRNGKSISGPLTVKVTGREPILE